MGRNSEAPERLRQLVNTAWNSPPDQAAAAWDVVTADPGFDAVSGASRGAVLFHAGAAHLRRFWASELPEDAHAAVRLLGEAVDTMAGESDVSVYEYNLGLALQARYERLVEGGDLTRSVTVFRDALRHGEGSSAAALTRLHLGQVLRLKANADRDRPARTEAMTLLTGLATADGSDPTVVADAVRTLGRVHLDEYRSTRLPTALDDAVDCFTWLTQSPVDDRGDAAADADLLAGGLLARYESTGNADDVEAGFASAVAAADLGAEHPDGRRLQANLASARHLRAMARQDVLELGEAIESMRGLIDEPHGDSEDRPGLLSNLSAMLLDRYELTGSLTDLEDGTQAAEAAVAGTPARSPGRPGRCHNLAIALRMRYLRADSRADLNRAITLHEEAVSLRSPDDVDFAATINSMANSLRARHDATHDVADLHRARQLYRDALDSLPEHAAERAMLMNNMGAVLAQLGVRTGDFALIDEAADWSARATRLAPPTSLEYARAQINLGNALSDRYQRNRDPQIGAPGPAGVRQGDARGGTPTGCTGGTLPGGHELRRLGG